MFKVIRLTLGSILFIGGILLTIVPGSMLIVLSGLVLLSYDWPRARGWLTYCQNSMSRSAKRLDKFLLARKLR
jgi:glucose dehydrogenase